ncbi:MAG: hypothetical protein ACOYM3_10360 [Terrimicrobiaceae bacterium]
MNEALQQTRPMKIARMRALRPLARERYPSAAAPAGLGGAA